MRGKNSAGTTSVFILLSFLMVSICLFSGASNCPEPVGGIEQVDLGVNDLPSSYLSTFSGESASGTVSAYFTNQTGISHHISVKNNETSEQRTFSLDLSNYSLPGFSIYKAEVNVTSNQVTAQDDWMFVEDNATLTDREIMVDDTTSNYQMLAQEINEQMRFELKEASLYYTVISDNITAPAPVLELANKSAGTAPDQIFWSTGLSLFIAPGWHNHNPSFIINASNPANYTWLMIINGTDWGQDAGNFDGSSRVRWYRSSSTPTIGWTKTWATPWDDEPTVFGMKYRRLYLDDATSSNRTFTPSAVHLNVDGMSFNATGSAIVSAANITSLNFTSNTTSFTGDVDVNLFYKKDVTSTRAFVADGSSIVNWTITSQATVSFPSGSYSNSLVNLTIPANWEVWGVFNASTIPGLAAAANYTGFTLNGNVLTITGIVSSDYWQVRLNSTNQISDIREMEGVSEVSTANVTDGISFEIDLESSQSTGNLTLGVYYPAVVNDSLAFSTYNDSFGGPVTNVTFGDTWTIPQNVLGNHRVQARWNTSEAVGFFDETFQVVDEIDPATSISWTTQPDGNITILTNFTLNPTDVGSGVLNTTYRIVNSSFDSGLMLYSGTFNFGQEGITFNGLYNLTWYSEDVSGNVEATNLLELNLTRFTQLAIDMVSQPDFSYANSSLPIYAYYGANVTVNFTFSETNSTPVLNPTMLNVSLETGSGTDVFSTYNDLGSGQYSIVINVSALDIGTYNLNLSAYKAGYHASMISTTLVMAPSGVNLSIGTPLQDGTELTLSTSSFWIALMHKDVNLVVNVTHVFTGNNITFGTINFTYWQGTTLLYSINVTDIDDGALDGSYNITLPSTVQVLDDGILKFQWISGTANFNNTVENDPANQALIRFDPIVSNINWFQLFLIIALIILTPSLYLVIEKNVIKPRRLRKQNFLAKISSAFEDAANIQHLLIIHKNSGTCLFFKSYGKETIDPDLISGFLSAVQSFGQELSGSKFLEELKYGDYQIVLGEGKTIRLALVLASRASPIMKSLVPKFISTFEDSHAAALSGWRGDLTSFRDAPTYIDAIFDTSIILPHKKSDLPINPRSSLAKKIVDVVEVLTKDRDYFFLATLLSESITRTKRSYNEVIAAIQELREDEILVSIDIESLEKQVKISQQEMAAMQQKVQQITFLNPQERAKFLQELAQMRPDERQATLSSMMMMGQLQSGTAQATGRDAGMVAEGTITVDSSSITSKKAALKQIKQFDKDAKVCLKNYQYEEAVAQYEAAEIIANEWNLNKEAQEIIHKKIEANKKEIQYNQAMAVQNAKDAESKGSLDIAMQWWQQAANYSSALFKLGVQTEDKKMREFTKQAERLRKQIGGQ
ncbi:MAG: hypothetical protein ACTSU9_15200 [Promethearchaeota archaeon]